MISILHKFDLYNEAQNGLFHKYVIAFYRIVTAYMMNSDTHIHRKCWELVNLCCEEGQFKKLSFFILCLLIPPQRASINHHGLHEELYILATRNVMFKLEPMILHSSKFSPPYWSKKSNLSAYKILYYLKGYFQLHFILGYPRKYMTRNTVILSTFDELNFGWKWPIMSKSIILTRKFPKEPFRTV